MRRRAFLAGSIAAVGMAASGRAADLRALELIAPAGPGGGWDQTARAMQDAMRAANVASRTQVTNINGAGGTIGLARFVGSYKGRGDSLMVSGLVMEGAILTNKSQLTLADTTPIARLTGEYQVIAVTAGSPLKTMADLVAMLRKDVASVSWGGGSAGGTDHILAGLVAKAVGANPKLISYVAHSGGGEAMASVLGGHTTVGVNGYAEFATYIKTGKLRVLGISSAERVAGIDGPTLREQDVNVAVTNWRGVVAAPGISDPDRAALSAAVEKMAKSARWKELMVERQWLDMYQPAAEFDVFMRAERIQVTEILKDIGLV